MEAIQTHTVQVDAHAAAMVQGQECIQTFSTLLSILKTSINTDADHIKQINQTFVEKDEALKNVIEKAVMTFV